MKIQMDNKKLIRIAKILSEDMVEINTPTDVFTKLMHIGKKQTDYFRLLGPDSLIKITVLIWSFKSTGDYKLAEDIFNTMNFVVLLKHEEDFHEEDCDECRGGSNDCGSCDGTGNQECYECEGAGEVTCHECDGSGVVDDDEGGTKECENCEGTGMDECGACGGDGTESCDECDGDGNTECNACDGQGYVTSDTEYNYELTYMITWSKEILSNLEYSQKSQSPLLGKRDINDYETEYIVTDVQDGLHDEFEDWVESYDYYVVIFDDTEKLIMIPPKISWSFHYSVLDRFFVE